MFHEPEEGLDLTTHIVLCKIVLRLTLYLALEGSQRQNITLLPESLTSLLHDFIKVVLKESDLLKLLCSFLDWDRVIVAMQLSMTHLTVVDLTHET